MSSESILVLGDMMLDIYTHGEVSKISPEAPVSVFKPKGQNISLGGAASVCSLVKSLGVDVIPCGLVGDDSCGKQVLDLLWGLKLKSNMVLTDSTRLTTTKKRYISQGQHILRVDEETVKDAYHKSYDELITAIEYAMWKAKVLLISDYNKGVCSEKILSFAISHAKYVGITIMVDPAYISDYSRYADVNILKPNQREAELATGIQIRTIDDAYKAGERLLSLVSEAVIITLGKRGIVLVDKNGLREHIPVYKVSKIYDLTGAGDTVLAVLGVCRFEGRNLKHSLNFANAAASVQIQKMGVASLSYDEILNNGTDRKILTLEQCKDRIAREHIVLANGCFDLLHIGHISHLQAASNLADKLVVAINSDESVKKLKGPSRPIIPQKERARTIASLEFVDYVIVFDEDTPHKVINELKPDILVKGTGGCDDVVGKELVESYGGQVKVTDQSYDISTTSLVNKMKELSYG